MSLVGFIIWLSGACVCAGLGFEAWRAEPSPRFRQRIVLIAALCAWLWPALLMFAAACIVLELSGKHSRLRGG